MLGWMISGLWTDRVLILRLAVLFLPLVWFLNARGEARFAQVAHFAWPWWACALQLLAVLLALFITQLLVRVSRRSRWTRLPLSLVRLALKCSAAYFIGYLTALT